MELQAPSHWRCADFISDLHLQSAERHTFQVFADYLQYTQADALFILGDLFEVWVGDDALLPGSFEAECATLLRQASQRMAVYIMHGNRDFLMGASLMSACGATALPDPSVLVFSDKRYLLSHADALCLGDQPYQDFRKQVRSPAWQQAFLAKPLAQRQSIARGIRQASEDRKQSQAGYADVDTAAALALMEALDSTHLLHGHTHQPAQHTLDAQHVRSVLSDWDAAAKPPRADVLRLRLVDAEPVLERLSPQTIIAGVLTKAKGAT